MYRDSEHWPSSQRFALTQQLQRAVLSVASNIVEGSTRATAKEYRRFIEIAYGSACEAQYQLEVARELGFSDNVARLQQDAVSLCKTLGALLEALPKA